MDDSLMDSFDEGASSDFAPPAKPAKATKAKAAPKKPAGTAKPRGRPPKDPSAPPKARAKAAPKKKKVISDDENSDIDMNEAPLDDESLLDDTPPKQKKAAAPKKTGGNPLADIANESFDTDGIEKAPGAKAKKAAGGPASSKYQMVCLCAAVPLGSSLTTGSSRICNIS
jgi:DNA topoisomerase II